MAVQVRVSPVTVEVIRNLLTATVDELEQYLIRTSYSPVVYAIQDVAAAWLDTSARIISQGRTGLPIFMADLSAPVQDGLDLIGLDGFDRGDVVLTNHSGTCGQHVNNVVAYSPMFSDDDRLLGFTAARSHWTDLGGASVGSWDTVSSDIYGEGIQFRTVRIIKAGRWDEELLRVLRHNTRFADEMMGDLRAQVAACRLGERRFLELVRKYGEDVLESAIHAIWDQSERVSRDLVAQIPDGEYSAESCLDSDGRALGTPVPIKVTIRVSGTDMEVDYSEMGAQVAGPINSGRSAGVTAARVAFKYLTDPELSADEGVFRPLKVTLPDGKFISAREPAPMGLWSTPLPTIIDTTMTALAPALSSLVPAAHMGDQAIWSIQGVLAGKLFLHVDSGAGGMGGWDGGDGASAVKGLAHGDSHTMPAELVELLFPALRVQSLALRPDSGGAGKWRGGVASERCFEILSDCTTHLALERELCPPWGLFGGHEGERSGAEVLIDGQPPTAYRKGTDISLPAGARLRVWAAGGGGYGDPTTRDPDLVLRDVIAGYISTQSAYSHYHVVIHQQDGHAVIDVSATSDMRRPTR